MPDDRNGTTHGVWFGPQDEHLPDRFKKTFKMRRDPFALSGEIRHAMRMHIAVQSKLDELGIGDRPAFSGEDRNESREAEANKREWVKQAIEEKYLRDRVAEDIGGVNAADSDETITLDSS